MPEVNMHPTEYLTLDQKIHAINSSRCYLPLYTATGIYKKTKGFRTFHRALLVGLLCRYLIKDFIVSSVSEKIKISVGGTRDVFQ